MNNKYLPIGTTCNINSENGLLMIIGFKKNGKDYEAVHYPEGTSGSKGNVYFNHDEINELYALGYKNQDSISYSKKLNENGNYVSNETVLSNNESNSSSIVDKYIFDENGIIIADNTVSETKEEPKTSIFDKYVFDENGVVIADNSVGIEPAKVEDVPTFGEIEFDENGVVISKKADTAFSKYEFDENGIIIAEHKEGE